MSPSYIRRIPVRVYPDENVGTDFDLSIAFAIAGRQGYGAGLIHLPSYHCRENE